MENKRTSKPLKINELTSQLFEQKRIKNNILQAQVQNTWEKLMGNNVIKRTNKIFIKEKREIISFWHMALSLFYIINFLLKSTKN